MLYRVVRAINRGYAFAVFWLYVAAFLLAFTMVFVFPPGTILLLFLSIFGLVFFVATGHLIRLAAGLMARRYLRRDTCPACREQGTMEAALPSRPEEVAGNARACRNCGAVYLDSGAEDEELVVRYSARTASA